MHIFDIIGPVMVGPSSSHTAGAVRIGYITKKLIGEEIKEAQIFLYGSFLATGKGHGTDRALVAGLLGMSPDNEGIPASFEIAKKQNILITFHKTEFREAHPNTVMLQIKGKTGKTLEVVAASLGGGRIQICKIDGFPVHFSGDYPTLIVHNLDQPGYVTKVTSMLAKKSINIATMQLYRDMRGGNAVMIIECDQEVSEEFIKWLEELEGIVKVTYLGLQIE